MLRDDAVSVRSWEEILSLVQSGAEVPVTVNGNSMYPFLRNGLDTVCIASLTGKKIKRGSLVLFQRANGQYVMHRVYKIKKNGTCCFVGDNQTVLEKGIAKEQLRAFVPFVCRDGRTVSCEHGVQHRLLTVYMRLHLRCPKFSYLLLAVNSKLLKIIRSSGRDSRCKN